MRQLLRFGYDGAAFRGWARQPKLRTIEGEIRAGLVRQGIQSSTDTLRLEVASRTDRGVSARGNALTLESDLAPGALLRAMNGLAPEIFFTAIARVDESFPVRHAVRRVYRYFEPPGDHDAHRWERVAQLMVGEIDVRSFGRGIPSEHPMIRTVQSIRVASLESGLVVEVTGPSFVWNQVRKMVGALRAVESGKLAPDRLRAAARGERRISLPLAEPDRLVLWDVEFPVEWELRWSGPNRRQRKHWEESLAAMWSRSKILSAFEGENPTPVSRPAPTVRASGRR